MFKLSLKRWIFQLFKSTLKTRKEELRQVRQNVVNRNYLVWDCGSNSVTVASPNQTSADECHHISKEDFLALNIPGLVSGMSLFGEEAHYRARLELSLAHQFTQDELDSLRENATRLNIGLWMLNQDQAPAARDCLKAMGSTGDEIDAFSWAKYLMLEPAFVLSQLRQHRKVDQRRYQIKRIGITEARKALNDDLSRARTVQWKVDDKIIEFINMNLNVLYEMFDEEQRRFLGLRKVYAGRKNEAVRCDIRRLYPLVATMLQTDGELRLRPDTETLPFWNWIADNILGLRGSHRRSGVMASIYKHDQRPMISEFKATFETMQQAWQEQRLGLIEDGEVKSRDPQHGRIRAQYKLDDACRSDFRKARNQVDKLYRGIWRSIRALIVEQYAYS